MNVKTTGKISGPTMEVIRRYVKAHNITLRDINQWMKDELLLTQKQRVYVMDLLERDLEGFIKGVVR
jgi:hypothetical protein